MDTPMPYFAERLERRLSLRTRDGLLVDATTDADDPILASFFEGYDLAFVLANEKEELEGFRTCMALNRPPRYLELREQYGPFREVVLVATDPTIGALIGGANFMAFPVVHGTAATPTLCANLNYLYSDTSRRRQGYLRRLVSAVAEVILALFPHDRAPEAAGRASDPQPVIFLEQNDPLRLSPAQYAHDTEHSGIDQVDRIGIWAKLGTRILDFPYVQPPLSAEQEADTTLLYSMLGTQAHSVEPALLRQHLFRFFGISVLKGGDPATDAGAVAQFALLDEMQARGATIPLLDPAAWLAQLPPPGTHDRLRGLESEVSLRDVLRRFQPS